MLTSRILYPAKLLGQKWRGNKDHLIPSYLSFSFTVALWIQQTLWPNRTSILLIWAPLSQPLIPCFLLSPSYPPKFLYVSLLSPMDLAKKHDPRSTFHLLWSYGREKKQIWLAILNSRPQTSSGSLTFPGRHTIFLISYCHIWPFYTLCSQILNTSSATQWWSCFPLHWENWSSQGRICRFLTLPFALLTVWVHILSSYLLLFITQPCVYPKSISPPEK